MFPFVRRSTYEAERKNRLAWMQKSADNEREMLNATRKFNALLSHIRMAYSEACRVPLEASESVLED
jgi:hypothetical protein